MVISPVFAQQIERPFSAQNTCTTSGTGLGERDSCYKDAIWPDDPSERPNVPWAIIPESVQVVTLDERGTGSGCFSPRFEYEQRSVFLPEIGSNVTVGIPVRVIVSMNARSEAGIGGAPGRIACKVIGNYRSL
ncbi:hypothetical protein [Nostoc sp. FACHB-888]|uniref:hypothetical protein n=1 Tax=Nostoc sp. FACHB-888 TaxID=2692842 RepID=UPI001689803F|nr:hypothetical protein [Nostoc sp. FACHB-888]MBD2246289.1 hypothetical protein [Nostoc sp. FACHB-888]